MKPLHYLIIFAIFSSCANILNDRSQSLDVYCNKPFKIFDGKDTLSFSYNTTITLNRTKNNKKLIFITDTLEKTITLSPHFSAAFIWGNLYPLPFFAHIIDVLLDNDIIYSYDNEIYVDMNSSEDDYNTLNLWDSKENAVFLNISIPEGNYFIMNEPDKKIIRKFGFLGIGAGIDYYYMRNKYLSLHAKAAANYQLPIFIPADFGGPEITIALFISLQDFHDFGRLQLGYGFQFTHFYDKDVERTLYEPTYYELISKTQYCAFGAALSANWLISEFAKLGLHYNPSIYSYGANGRFEYSHLLYFDIQLFGKIFY